MIRLIAALDDHRGIATDSGIPWNIPADVAHFRDQTRTGQILMGRTTYLEFAEPLHDPPNYVLTTSKANLREGFVPVASLAQLRAGDPTEDIWVIGGAAVYTSTIDEGDELVLTQVRSDFHCTRFFPAFADQFALSSRGPDSQDGGVRYRFETWRRRSGADTAPA